jgi:glycosyltransferase involved in cell wall biosynthesis
MSDLRHSLIVVTPVFEDTEASSHLFRELAAQFSDEVYIVAVDDGSVREPLDVSSFNAAGIDGVILKLRRNVGHQRAIAIGLAYVAERMTDRQFIVVMDSDGEDLPATIPALLSQLESVDVDVVVAQRKSRMEPLSFKISYRIYKGLFRLMTGKKISFGNFMALKPSSVRRLAAMQELTIHVAGTVLASRLRTGICPIDRGPRYAGQSKMSFVGLALHGFKGLMVFAEDVLVRAGIACVLISVFSVAGIIAAIVLKTLGVATPGWFSVALGILILILLQTAALALMTLMLTGVVRGGTVTSSVAYREFIEAELPTDGARVSRN